MDLTTRRPAIRLQKPSVLTLAQIQLALARQGQYLTQTLFLFERPCYLSTKTPASKLLAKMESTNSSNVTPAERAAIGTNE